MLTPPAARIQSAEGLKNVVHRLGAVPVGIAALVENRSRDAIYQRIERGSQSWYCVYGEIWVVPRVEQKKDGKGN